MRFLRKEICGGQKFLRIWKLRIPYQTEAWKEGRRLKIGPFSIPYRFYQKGNKIYLQLWRLRFRWGSVPMTRKEKHFKKKERLSTKYCIELLKKELTESLGYCPDIESPKSFNEKILWLKFFYHDPLITTCCDKYAVKEYVARCVGDSYVLPVLSAWEDPREIDFASLPQQFVLKVNWSSGYNIIVKDKAELDIPAAIEQLTEWIRPERNSYFDTFNWGYKDMRPVIYAEPYIEQCDGQVYDYKFFINEGHFLFMFIATDRHGDHSLTYTFYDSDFQPLPFTYGGKPNADPIPQMPYNLEKMVKIAKKLAEPFPFVRVDFYEVSKTEFYVGEMTFYSGGGTLGLNPVSWDYELGARVKLPEKRAG